MRDFGGGETRGLYPAEAKIVAHAAAVRCAGSPPAGLALMPSSPLSGRPILPYCPGQDRAPLWPDGFVGSISHARGVCAAVAASRADAASLSLDVELWAH